MSFEGAPSSFVSTGQPGAIGPNGFEPNMHRVVVRYANGTGLSLRRDGADIANAVIPTPVDVSAVGFPIKIGAGEPGARCIDGEIAEIVLVNKALDGAGTADLETYFKAKYGL
jgi:hypothetical protein